MKKDYIRRVLVYWLLASMLQPAAAGDTFYRKLPIQIVYGLDNPPIICETSKQTRVFFANGMRNSNHDAVDSLWELKGDLQAVLPGYLRTNNNVDFDLAYNEKESLLLELLEVAAQQEYDNFASSFYDWLIGALGFPELVKVAYREF